MSLPVKSQQDLYDLCQTTMEDYAPDLTDWNEGSDLDAIAGVVSVAGNELTRLIVDLFNKTFIDLANGPEVTLGPDDLQFLAVDHFGSSFARPGAVAAIDTFTFVRANNANGSVLIPAGTVVKTKPDANGNVQRYTTDSDVTMTNNSSDSDLAVTVSITAVVPGAASTATYNVITVIESTLLDNTITGYNAGNATGADAENDSDYRETIRNLILALAGATAASVAAKAKTVTGIVTATAIEQALTVIQYNVATSSTVGSYFRVPIPYLYVADATGTASVALLNAVKAAIDSVRALGVFVQVLPASAVMQDWTASFTLNVSGPNYSTFVNDPSKILQSMTDYINALPIGTGFVRATANAAILAIWGASGTNDLTDFSTSVPSGDTSVSATQKLVAGNVLNS